MKQDNKQFFSNILKKPLESLDFIQENKYCSIFKAVIGNVPYIIKHYKGNDPALADTEKKALDFYHQVAVEDSDLIDSGKTVFYKDENILRIGFVEGEPFSALLYRAAKDTTLRERCLKTMKMLGKLLGDIRIKTEIPNEETDPFMFEYIRYCSDRLEKAPILGKLFFRGMKEEAEELCNSLIQSQTVPSFAHGDFVFLNIHVHKERVGLIDFANAIEKSHPLNDIYNLRMALNNMILPKSFKKELWSAFYCDLKNITFSEDTHHFYYEYHRRRWLMLKVLHRGFNKQHIQGFRGLFSFACPFSKDVIASIG
jgi:hypothetical protein